VVVEKTPDGGETLKVTITNSDTGGQAQTRGHAREPILRITDGLERSSGRSGNAEEPRRPRTFKPRRPEIGTWKTNTFKATGRLVKSSPTFDQLLSKYMKRRPAPATGHQNDLAYPPRSDNRLGRSDHLTNRKRREVIMFN
jgi:hypothetical protein